MIDPTDPAVRARAIAAADRLRHHAGITPAELAEAVLRAITPQPRPAEPPPGLYVDDVDGRLWCHYQRAEQRRATQPHNGADPAAGGRRWRAAADPGLHTWDEVLDHRAGTFLRLMPVGDVLPSPDDDPAIWALARHSIRAAALRARSTTVPTAQVIREAIRLLREEAGPHRV